jgi:hypothetical protein
MSKLIRIKLSVDSEHSLTQFPVNVFTGMTEDELTLVLPNVIESPQDIFIDNEITSFFVKLTSIGCLDRVFKVLSPNADCHLCADIREIFPVDCNIDGDITEIFPIDCVLEADITEITISPTPTPTDTPVPTPTDTPEPTATQTPEPTPTETPLPTATAIPLDCELDADIVETYTCQCITYTDSTGQIGISYSYIDCDGQIVNGETDGITSQFNVCGSNPTSNNVKLTFTIGPNCLNGECVMT